MEKTLLVIGATGFVGKRFLKHVLPYAEAVKIRVKACGRTPAKLQLLAADFPNLELATLNTLNAADTKKGVKGAYAVVNCAGPFDLYGENVVAACAEYGVHYLDITGEAVFGRRMIERYDAKASESGALIVPFAGFDSVPSDMAAFLIAKEFYQLHKKPVESMDLVFSMRGGVNGGTIATALDMTQKISAKEMADRHYLTPGHRESLQMDAYCARYIPEMHRWVVPFFMEPVNSKVVYRSGFLDTKRNLAKDFQYRESISLPGGSAVAHGAALAMKTGAFLFKRFNRLAARVLPAPGSGPSEAAVENGFFKIDVIARGSDKILRKKMTCQGDPGNKATVKIVMACTKAIFENRHVQKGGLMTPSTAFGDELLPFLEQEGMTWSE